MPAGETAGPAENRLGLLLLVTTKVTVWPGSFGPALIPVAQPLTVCGPESSATLWSAPLVKLGASFTAVTAIVKVCVALVSSPPLAVPPLSLRETETVAVPFAFAAGVKVSTPVGETAGCTAKRALLSLETLNDTVWPDSLAGPALIDVAHPALYGPESSFTVTSPPERKLGASFTALTVIVTVAAAEVLAPSLAVYVKLSVPLKFSAGV